ncbi:MAG: chromosome segregation protein SMC [Clostridia bacterium]|nr:chromosome segregation protein SMC [Clostridia bacterium]
MRLSKLEIYGFKSFAERTTISFEQGVTGIVGPNGCGKSNIADAVRWVLGEQSAKTLRGARMEDVIFGGTEKRRRLSYCEVALTFENEDRVLPMDFNEVCVSRRVYRSGDAEYSINHSTCRLRDVIDLFRDTGIGKEGYSLIGQGRIDEILSVKSEDRRQVFEEAAGIVKYKARRSQAQKSMENTQDNLDRVEDIMRELDSQLGPLKQQSATAREFMQLREELKTLELSAFIVNTDRLNERISKLDGDMTAAKGEQQSFQEKSLLLAKARDEAQAALDQNEEEAGSLRERVQYLIAEVESRDGALVGLKERIKAAAADKERLQRQLAQAERGKDGIDEEIAALDLSIAEKTVVATKLRFEQDSLERDCEVKREKVNAVEAEAETAKSDVIAAINSLSDVKSDISRLTAMKEAIMSRLSSVENDAGAVDVSVQTTRVEQARKRLAEQLAVKDELSRECSEADKTVRESADDAERLKARMSALNDEKQSVSSRLSVLNEMKRDYEGYQFSVKNVLQYARRSPSSGVRGVIADVIRAPGEYERAIEVALGAAVQHIVTDDEQSAKQMIDYLKKNRLGRATFLPLTTVRGRTLESRYRQLENMDGWIGVASDLVDCAGEYRDIVENLLGRTVIARDLDAGIAITRSASHAFRLVTLDGDVMNPGGSMTGGSAQSRVTSLLSREREIDEHTKRLEQIDVEMDEVLNRSEALEKERANFKRERSKLYDALHQQDIACTREEEHLKRAEEELTSKLDDAKRLETAIEQLKGQLSDVSSRLEGLSGSRENSDVERQKREEDVSRLQTELSNFRQELEKAQSEASAGLVELTKVEKDLSAISAQRASLARRRGDTAKLTVEYQQSLRETENSIGEYEKTLAEDTLNLEQGREQLNRAREDFKKADDKRIAAQSELKSHNELMEENRAALDKATDKIHRLELQLNRAQTELSQITGRIWDEYELSYDGAMPFKSDAYKPGESDRRITALRQRIKELGPVNVAAVEQFRVTQQRMDELTTQRDDLVKAKSDLETIIAELSRKMERQFKDEFSKLNVYFEEAFKKLFGGGTAQLRLTDESDALNCGIEIVAQPPGKKLQLLSLLSGGERALTAIAILFSMLSVKPTPFCILDEIEAALDDANIDNYAEYLREFSKHTQFVVVTHRKGTMVRCDGLYGVSMVEKGVSNIVSVRLSDVEQTMEEHDENFVE